jgi:hypothetical protein
MIFKEPIVGIKRRENEAPASPARLSMRPRVDDDGIVVEGPSSQREGLQTARRIRAG